MPEAKTKMERKTPAHNSVPAHSHRGFRHVPLTLGRETTSARDRCGRGDVAATRRELTMHGLFGATHRYVESVLFGILQNCDRMALVGADAAAS